MATKSTDTQPEKPAKKITIDEKSEGIRGVITLNEDVVTTIAGLAAREVDGIWAIGKSRFISFGEDIRRGIKTEVGQQQAAFDIDVILEYGKDIKAVAKQLREKTAKEVAKMAGKDVVEININVVDIKLPEDIEPKAKPRVQ